MGPCRLISKSLERAGARARARAHLQYPLRVEQRAEDNKVRHRLLQQEELFGERRLGGAGRKECFGAQQWGEVLDETYTPNSCVSGGPGIATMLLVPPNSEDLRGWLRGSCEYLQFQHR